MPPSVRRIVLPQKWRLVQELMLLFFLAPTVVGLECRFLADWPILDGPPWSLIGFGAGGLLFCAFVYLSERRGRLVYLRPGDEEEFLRDRRLKLPAPEAADVPMRAEAHRPLSILPIARRLTWGAALAAGLAVGGLIAGMDSHPALEPWFAPALAAAGRLFTAALAVEAFAAVVKAVRVFRAGLDSD